MQRVIDELNSLRLDILEQDWVQGIFYSEFLEFGEFPPEYEAILESLEIRVVFHNIIKAIDAWLNEQYTDEDKSWAVLSHHVEHQKLLALLAYYIDYGTKNILTKEYRNNAMLACRVYYKLLSIPGYNAYHIYHSQLFAQSLACLGFPKSMCDQEDKYYNTKELTREVNSVIKELRHFVLDLRVIMHSLQLGPSDMNFEDIMSNLVDITGGAIVNKLHVDKIEYANISQVIYQIIDVLLCDSNGEPNTAAIRLLFKCILPKLVAASVDCKNANNLVRASYVTYSGLILTKYGKAALTGYTTLLEYLCHSQDGLERGEVRTARVSLVVGLMSLLPGKSYRKMIKWILKLSTTSRVPHRQIAMEILFQLMNNEPEEERPPEPEPQPTDESAVSTEQIDADQTTVDQPASDQPSSNQTTSDHSNAISEHPNPNQPLSEQVNSDQPSLEQSNPDQASSDQSKPDQPSLDQPNPDQVSLDKLNPDKASLDITKPDQVSSDQSNPNQPSLDQSNQPSSDQSNPDQSSSNQSNSDQPATDQSNPVQQNPEQPNPGVNLEAENRRLSSEIVDTILNESLDEDMDIPLSMLLGNTQDNFDSGIFGTPEFVIQETAEAPIQETPKHDKLKSDSKEKPKAKSRKKLVSVNPPTEASDETSQDSRTTLDTDIPEQDITEEEVAGLLRQRPHKAPYAEILRALYERLCDVSSNVRTRAFNMLTECLDNERAPMKKAIKELNGDGAVSRLMAWAARGVCDERAVVRRAALNLVHRSLAHRDAPTPTPHDIGILVGLCRDASIIVRSGAIGALGELTVQRPCQATFDAFLTGPMHQLSDPETKGECGRGGNGSVSDLVGLCRDANIIVRSGAIAALGELTVQRPCAAIFDASLTEPMHQVSDPETKVQQMVVDLVQQLLIDRMHKYIEGSCEDLLPWLFLAAVTRHNMRRHLQKACALLAKNTTCISHRLVDMLSTHLSALSDERDLHTLVLLTSVAKHVEYKEVDFALDYYYKLADSSDPRDGRLMALTLELLTTWAGWMRLAARTDLRSHIVQRLATADDDGTRLACATLARHLATYDLTWATQLMQFSEQRAVDSGEVAEWVRAADLSLVAPEPPSPELVKLFLTALDNPPPEWSPETLGVAVAGLGRLCVRSRDTAAAAAEPLAKLLQDTSASLAARINALYTLTDVCVRYTCIVEPLLGSVCSCVSGRSDALLRRAAARALTRLLLGGYLRLRPPLYYRYCALLADEDGEVREPAEYYVSCCLTADAIYHHFVDCVRHYNTDTDNSITFDARQLIYDVMLQRLSLVQILNLQCRLAREILEHAADVTDEGDGELPPTLNAALLDTIHLLCGPRMKLPKKPQRDADAGDMDDLQERVTTNIVSHKMKCTVAEILVPAVLRLHARLRGRGGQAVVYLVRLANDLLNDYRHEIEELIEDDNELVERVRQFQETIGLEPSFGNTRNLVTSSTRNDPETPRAPRKRAARNHARSPPRKRALRI